MSKQSVATEDARGIRPPVEIPRFFERSLLMSDANANGSIAEEPGEEQFRKDFQARWWPGDMKQHSPPAKG